MSTDFCSHLLPKLRLEQFCARGVKHGEGPREFADPKNEFQGDSE